jgi:hypothetical protein
MILSMDAGPVAVLAEDKCVPRCRSIPAPVQDRCVGQSQRFGRATWPL